MSTIQTSLLANPKILSLSLHFSVGFFLVMAGLSDDDVPAPAKPGQVEIIMERGLVEDLNSDGDPETKSDKTESVSGDASGEARTEKQVRSEAELPESKVPESGGEDEHSGKPDKQLPPAKVTMPNDLTYTDVVPVPSVPARKPVLVDNRIEPALKPEVAKDLAFVKQSEKGAVFHPEGQAPEALRSASQERASMGTKDEVVTKLQTKSEVLEEEKKSARTKTAVMLTQHQQVIQSENGGFELAVANEQGKGRLKRDSEQQANVGRLIEKPDSQPQTEGKDKINITETSKDPTARKVTTPLPKHKPRALARAFASDRLREARRREKLERKEQEQKRRKQVVKTAMQSKAIAKEEQEKQLPLGEYISNDEVLTNELNENILALFDTQRQEADQKAERRADRNRYQGASAYDVLSLEVGRITNRIVDAFYAPPGLDFSTVPSVTLHLEFNPDGTVASIRAGDQARYKREQAYRHMVESAKRAIAPDSALTELLDLPYEQWRSITISFDTTNLIGN